MLEWNEYELIEFFGVLPEFSDPANSHSFEVCRDGIKLLVTLFDLEGAVYVSMWRDGVREPLFTVQRELCTHAQITKDETFRPCFEAGSPAHPVSTGAPQPVLKRGVRVYVEPSFQVRLIEDRYV